MKRIFFIFLILNIFAINKAMDNQENGKDSTVKSAEKKVEGDDALRDSFDVSYASNIPLAYPDTVNLRSRTDLERAKLFLKMEEYFPLAKAIEQIGNTGCLQVVIWFTNYFGSVSDKTLEWYQKNIFAKMPKATFWLTDLKAWRFLSVDAEQLSKNYAALVEKMKQGKLDPSECPLVDKSSDILDEDAMKKIGAYKALSSQGFFKWLLTVKDKSLLPDDVANALCKDTRRDDSLPYSLATMGYKPELLNRSLPRYKTQKTDNMLEVDFSLIYPVLQYLEGVYYAAEVIKANCRAACINPGCAVVFLLPNKEFAYYLVPGEDKYFKNFKIAVQRVLKQDGINLSGLTNVQFQPFAYGKDFYDAPYYLGGKRFTKKTFLEKLGKK